MDEKKELKHPTCTGDKCLICHPELAHKGYAQEIAKPQGGR